MFSLYSKFTVAGATGARGVYVVRITAAYKQGRETAQIQSHSMVEINALDTKQLWESAAPINTVREVNEDN